MTHSIKKAPIPKMTKYSTRSPCRPTTIEVCVDMAVAPSPLILTYTDNYQRSHRYYTECISHKVDEPTIGDLIKSVGPSCAIAPRAAPDESLPT